jgi:subtilisin family serine protease
MPAWFFQLWNNDKVRLISNVLQINFNMRAPLQRDCIIKGKIIPDYGSHSETSMATPPVTVVATLYSTSHPKATADIQLGISGSTRSTFCSILHIIPEL